MCLSRSGIALITVIVFVTLISIIAIATISFLASQAILIEHQIQTIRARYATEGALQKNLMNLFMGLPVENITVDSFTITADPLQSIGNEPLSTSTLKVKTSY